MPIQRVDNEAGRITELILDARSGTLVVGDEAGVLRIWRLGESPEILRDIEPPFEFIGSLAWLPDRASFIAAGDGEIGAWTLTGAPLGVWPTIDAPPQSVAVVDSKRALVAYDDSTLRLIDMTAGAVLAEAPAGERNSGIARHPDGRRFAISACDQGGSRVLWVELEGHALRPLPELTIERNVDHLSTPAIDAGGKLLMVADHDLHVFDLGSTRHLRDFGPTGRRHRFRLRTRLLVERPWSQCVTVGTHALACASPEGPLYVFDSATRQLSSRSDLKRPATALTSDGAVIAAAGLDWQVLIWWP